MNRRDRRGVGQRGKLVDVEPVRLVVEHARSLGCTCIPDVRFTGPLRYGEMSGVTLAHDDLCPILAAGRRASAIVISNPEAGS